MCALGVSCPDIRRGERLFEASITTQCCYLTVRTTEKGRAKGKAFARRHKGIAPHDVVKHNGTTRMTGWKLLVPARIRASEGVR